MPRFRYIATETAARQRHEGEVVAENAERARARLAVRGWTVESLEEVADEPRLSDAEAAEAAQRIADVVALNLPLVSGIRAVAEECPSRRIQSLLNGLARDMEAGMPLEEAVSARQGRVPEPLLRLIEAGSQTRTLPSVLERYVYSVRRSAEIRRRMWIGLAYPAFMLAGGSALLLVFLLLVVPQFETIFRDFAMSLPMVTRIVIGISRWLREYLAWIAIVAGIVTVAAVLKLLALIRTVSGRRLLVLIPIVGPMLRLTALAQFAHLLGQFLDTRTPMPDALVLAGEACGDPQIAWAARGLATEVRNGVPLGQAATMLPGVPHDLRQVLRWSAESQKCSEVLFSAAEMCTARAAVQAVVLGPVLEPVALVTAGVVFGLMVVTIFLPLFHLLDLLA